MANRRIHDPTRATILGEEPPPSPLRPVSIPSPAEMLTFFVRPPKITNTPPEPPPARQTVALRVTARNVTDVKSESWLQSPSPLGMPVVAGGRMVSVVIAAKVMNFFAGGTPGSVIMELDLVFAPVTQGKIAEDWALRYEQDDGKLRKELTKALYMAFSRLPPRPGLVVRFVGGPPMQEVDARANGYHVWLNESRSPTRVEIDDRDVESAREVAESAYQAAEQKWFTQLTVAWWKSRQPIRYRNYLLGKYLAEYEDVAERTPQELRVLKTALSDPVGPVISSFSAVVFGEDLQAEAALKAKGRAPVKATRIERNRPTFMEHFEPLPEGAVRPLGDNEG